MKSNPEPLAPATPSPAAPHPPALSQPASLTDLFISFTVLALQGFGGVMAVAQRELVEHKRWYSREGFLEDWAVAQILPGPNIVNLALMFGDRLFGLRGAVVAVAGMLAVPMLVVLAVAALFNGVADVPAAQGALRGMGAVAAGLISATALRLAGALRGNVLGPVACAVLPVVTFVGIALLRLPLAWVLPTVGLLACIGAWFRLGRSRSGAGSARP